MESVKGELRRLRSGPGAEDDQRLTFLVRARFAAEDPAQVIANAREVLTCVVEEMRDWPADERWPQLLPAWFVERCAPEYDESFDADVWLRQWRAMTPEQKEAISEEPWTLSSWLDHFDPTEEGAGKDRSWWWWHVGTHESGGGWVQVATTGWPFGSDSLTWLIEASGGADIKYGP
ncbi:hypothetical protein [Streptomyces sp. H27-S2]|uniref:hypothetical protein n=1 Tax=Streptomyces antarcticus TaxID=2996458 RepID=UPI002270C8A8|nr:hypothetical protein [Streptomyces sp. H27-S2]MCY0953131.1 hypothetical protein [Streptomyces sp. H27-S2]